MKAKLWSVTCDTDFESGAGIQFSSQEPGVINFLAPWDSSPEPLWFYFRVRGAKGWTVRFVLGNATRCLGAWGNKLAGKAMRPVYTTDGPDKLPSKRRWKRVKEENICFNESDGTYTFDVKVQGDDLWVAHCYPYSRAAWEEFLHDLQDHPHLCVDNIGKTEEGLEIPHATITKGSRKGKRVIWLTARNHAAEVAGAWALDGHIRWLLSDDPEARWTREHYVTRVIPFVDLDGVVNGWYGKERAPRDFNRAWLSDSPRVEIRQYLKQIVKSPTIFSLDYHSPGACNDIDMFLPHRIGVPPERWPAYEFFAETVMANSPKNARISSAPEPVYAGDSIETHCRRMQAWINGTPGASPEMSYATDADGCVLTRKSYQRLGAACGKAVAETLRRFGNALPIMRWDEVDARLRLPGYDGDSYQGWFLWEPGSLKVVDVDGRDLLKATVAKQGCSVRFASPRIKLSRKIRLQHKTDFGSQAGPTVTAKLFYYDKHGLQCARHDLFSVPQSEDWTTTTIVPNPPKKAVLYRLSFHVTGGRGSFWIDRH